MHPILFITTLITIPFSLGCFSQSLSEADYYSATILDDASRKRLPFVQIYNESNHSGTISDSAGLFRIKANKGDTVIFICLGYLGKKLILDSIVLAEIHPVLLQPRIYEIQEVRFVFPRSYEHFKKAILALELEKPFIVEGLPHPKPRRVPLLLDTNYIQSTGFAITNPISYLYYNFSKEEQSKRKVQYLIKEEREQVRIDKKFNRELINKMTELEGEEITDFIVYCNFSHQYLYEATELEIVIRIEQKFKNYQTMKQMQNKPK